MTKCPFVGPGGRCKVQENPIGLLPTTLVAEPDHLKNRCLEVLKLQEELKAQHPCPLDLHGPQAMGPEGFAIFLVNRKTTRSIEDGSFGFQTNSRSLTNCKLMPVGPICSHACQVKPFETVEHVDPAEYQKDGGEHVLLRLLDARFPERDQTDELAEVLNEVFSLRATEGERLRAWVSRATDLFDRCERKGGVKFPEEARGFVLLKWSGLTEEQ